MKDYALPSVGRVGEGGCSQEIMKPTGVVFVMIFFFNTPTPTLRFAHISVCRQFLGKSR
jgi:hypothetical protein